MFDLPSSGGLPDRDEWVFLVVVDLCPVCFTPLSRSHTLISVVVDCALQRQVEAPESRRRGIAELSILLHVADVVVFAVVDPNPISRLL